MKTNKVLDTKNFDRDSYFEKIMDFVRSNRLNRKEQVLQILKTGNVTVHEFVDWFFESLGKLSGKNRTNYDDLAKLIDMDVFPKTFAMRKLDFTDKLDKAPQSFQDRYASVLELIYMLEKKIGR